MPEIELTCPFGDQLKKVDIQYDHLGTKAFRVIINGFYQGDIFQKNGEWTGYLNRLSVLTIDDIQILGEIIEGNLGIQK